MSRGRFRVSLPITTDELLLLWNQGYTMTPLKIAGVIWPSNKLLVEHKGMIKRMLLNLGVDKEEMRFRLQHEAMQGKPAPDGCCQVCHILPLEGFEQVNNICFHCRTDNQYTSFMIEVRRYRNENTMEH